MSRGARWARWLAWLATAWLLIVLLLSIFNYVRGLDPVVLLLALVAQITVLIAWLVYRPLPLWLVAGHGLIMLSLAFGLVIAAPPAPPAETLFGLRVAWLLIGLIPAGVAMILAALLHWDRSTVVGH
ncbi:MAG: hypothetical protein M3N29_01310 [Chloroflexota bacterium]|nr:hypothetical protein [Chloroflexota bacterium]